MTDLLDPIRAVNPIREADLPDVDADAFVQRVLVTPGKRPVPRRLALAGVATVAAAALGALPLVLPAQESSRWTPNAAAAELDVLATHVRTPALGDRYLYVHRRLQLLETTLTDGRRARWTTTTDAEGWTGSDCDDRSVSRVLSVGFPTETDRALWPDVAHKELGESQKPGYVLDARGRDLWASMPDYARTEDPCGWPGAVNFPNPAYVSGLPDEPRALLDRLARDDAALGSPGAGPGPDSLRNDLLTFIDLPWLTDRQRAAMIQALGLLPGGLGAKGYETVAGHRGLLLVSESDGFRSETVVSADAPGVLRRSLTVVDPARAAKVHPAGRLARGTVMLSDTLVASGLVATTDDRVH